MPRPGETGHDTWAGDSWRDRSGTNVWGFYETVDKARGIAYLPVASPSANYYGGDRKGANLFGNALVAVDVATGKYKWHFQTIHHDLWDADPPAAPGLVDIVQNGKKIPALARVSFKMEDLVTAEDTTPEHAQACRDLVQKNGGVYNSGPYTPWAFHAEGAPVKTTLVFPGGTGGANWGGTATDPKTGYVYVDTMDDGAMGWIDRSRRGSPLPYDKAAPEGGRGAFDVRIVAGGNWPCQKPPWGRLTAVNANTGDIAWQIPLGITEKLPAGKQNTGHNALAGPIVTAGGVVFVGATNDNRFRAIDAKTGKELWAAKLERTANATPMTYQAKNGKQYVAVSASDSLQVFALP